MCHISWFYLLDGIRTSRSHMACELEGRVIPMHKGRHERTWPGKDLDSETVSGTEIGKLLLQSFLKQGILCVQGGHVSIYG